MTLREFLLDAKKALGALAALEVSAVGFGVLDSATAGYVTAGIGIATAGVVYLLDNEKPAPKTPSVEAAHTETGA